MAEACDVGSRFSAGAAASGLSDGIQPECLLRCHQPAGLEAVSGHLFSARPFAGIHAAPGAERLEDYRHCHQWDGTGPGAGHTVSLVANRTLSISRLGTGTMGYVPAAVRAGIRWVLTLLRSIPELVWALIFVRAVGLGDTAGVMAIALTYAGHDRQGISGNL
jgi:hypothetical protein